MPQYPEEHSMPAETPAPMSRRSVLRGAAGAGAAGLAIGTLAGGALASPALAAAREDGAADTAARGEHAADDAVVVHVLSVRSGEIDVYRGTTHVRVTDRALAARLARASR
jgi:hypothetical protein